MRRCLCTNVYALCANVYVLCANVYALNVDVTFTRDGLKLHPELRPCAGRPRPYSSTSGSRENSDALYMCICNRKGSESNNKQPDRYALELSTPPLTQVPCEVLSNHAS